MITSQFHLYIPAIRINFISRLISVTGKDELGKLGAGRTRQNFCLLCKKKLSTSVIDENDRRVSLWQNFVRPYQTSKKPRQKIGVPKGRADFLSLDFIALFCLFSVTIKSASNWKVPVKSTSVQQAISVPKVRFSAVSRSSWRWAVHAITNRWTGIEREFI